MTRYFFHHQDRRLIEDAEDAEGVELADLEAAKPIALQALVEWLNRRPAVFWPDGDYRLVVQDEHGLTLFTLYLSAVMAPAASGGAPPV